MNPFGMLRTRRPRWLAAGWFLIPVVFCLAAPVLAQTARKTAEDYTREGDVLVEKGDLEGAYKAALAAWSLEKSYTTASHLGIVEITTDRMRDAAEHLAFAEQNYPLNEGATPDAWRTTLRWLLATAKEKVGTARIRLTANDGRSVDKAEVLVSGTPVGRWPLGAPEVFVDPGTRTFVARLPGCADARWRADVKANTAFDVPLTLACRPTPPRKPK